MPGLRPLRRELLESALTFYEEFVRKGGGDPGAVADLAATQVRIGQILADLGARDKARAAWRTAVGLYDKLLAARPRDIALLERQSEVWHRLGDLEFQADRPTGHDAYREAVAIRERLARDHPSEPRFRMALSRSFNGVGIAAASVAEQLDAYRRSLELRLKLADEIPEDPDLLHGLSESFLNLAMSLQSRGHLDEALALMKHSIDYGEAGVTRRPHDSEFALDLGTSYRAAAGCSAQLGRLDEALAISEAGVAYQRKLSASNPDVSSYQFDLAFSLAQHGGYLARAGKSAQGVSVYRQAAETFERMPDPDAEKLAYASNFRGAPPWSSLVTSRPGNRQPGPSRRAARPISPSPT